MRVKEIVKSKGMTINELAMKLGITRQALSKQIKGKLLVETAERIANALEVPVWQLFVSEDEILESHGLEPRAKTPEFVAMIKNGDDFYCATSISEAREILAKMSK